MNFKERIPLLGDLRSYTSEKFKGDISAGLTVGVMLIPQGMAIAVIAGLPPLFGLYAATIPLVIYSLLGTSRQMAVGPVALVAFLVFSGLSELHEAGSTPYIELTLVLALMIGFIHCCMGVFRLGFLVNFLSSPVINGFTSALAVIIVLVQVEVLLGIPRSQVSDPLILLPILVQKLPEVHVITTVIGLASVVFLMIMRRVKRSFPSALLATVLVMLLTFYGQLQEKGVVILGDVPSGLPGWSMPQLSVNLLSELFPLALTIAVIAFLGSISMAKAMHEQHSDYKLVPNQELIALGLANMIGGLFQSLPVAGGLSRTAVNNESGARTGVAGLISAFIVAIALIFLTPALYYLPKMILAAIIMVAASGLINTRMAKELWRTDKVDLGMLVATFLGTLILGVQEGIFIGVSLSVGAVVYKTSRPHMAVLGRVKGTNIYKNIERFGTAEMEEGVLVLRFDDRLYFANVGALKDKLDLLFNKSKSELKLFILDAQSISDVDSTGVKTLFDILSFCQTNDIGFVIVSAIGPVRDKLYKSGFVEKIGSKHFHERVQDAVEWFEKAEPNEPEDFIEFQTNLRD